MMWLLRKILVLVPYALILVTLVALRVIDPAPVQLLRLTTFDYYQKLNPRTPPPEWQETSPVLIVDIDEKSLAELGQFPWPRYRFAQLIDLLAKNNIAAVGFDILFAEPDRTSPGRVLEGMREHSDFSINSATAAQLAEIDYDKLFARSITDRPVVLAHFTIATPTQKLTGKAGQSSIKGVRGADPGSYLFKLPGQLASLPILEDAARTRGLVSLAHEVDGVVRRVPTVIETHGTRFPALSIELVRLFLGGKLLIIKGDAGGMSALAMPIRGGTLNIPTDARSRMWVHYASPDPFNTPNNTGRMYVSASDILSGKYPPAKLAGRIALVGTSAAGVLDIRSTPISPTLPGVEVHANIIENILSGSFMNRPAWILPAELTAFIIGFLLITTLLLLVSPLVSALVFLGFLTAVVATSWLSFTQMRLMIDASFPVLSIMLTFTLISFIRFRKNAQEKAQVRSAFGQYLSPALVEQLADNPERLTLGGERREMTLLFCDVRGFTTISEQFRTNPEGLTHLINSLLTPLTEVILHNQGTIDKYMGDCIMAFWNAPIDCPQHADLAARSAREMHEALARLNTKFAEEAARENRPHHELAIGVGVNSGQVVVGNMGSTQRFDYSVLGDAVNLASRLEGQSKSYSVGIVIGESSLHLMSEAEKARLFELDLIAVKGKKEAVRVYTSIAENNQPKIQAIVSHQQIFLLAYRSQNWREAEQLAEAALNAPLALDELCKYYEVMLGRIAEFKQKPPAPDWDGVYTATTK